MDRIVGCIFSGPHWSVLWVTKHLVTGADSRHRNLDVPSQRGQRFFWSEVARHHPQQVDAHAILPMSQEVQDQHCPCAPHVRIPAPGRSAALRNLEGAMTAWHEVSSVFPELRKIVAHCSKQNVTGRAAVHQAILLVEVSNERLVDLCVRYERGLSATKVCWRKSCTAWW